MQNGKTRYLQSICLMAKGKRSYILMVLKTADVGYLTRRLDTGFLFNFGADLKETIDGHHTIPRQSSS
jgi:hypothetical protein